MAMVVLGNKFLSTLRVEKRSLLSLRGFSRGLGYRIGQVLRLCASFPGSAHAQGDLRQAHITSLFAPACACVHVF